MLVSYLSRGTRPECEIVGTDWCNTNAAKNQEKEKREPRQVKKQNKEKSAASLVDEFPRGWAAADAFRAAVLAALASGRAYGFGLGRARA